ncbi:response regulator [Maridesulfovibrio frigidus]|uniref:response regulator n=1 Tax=Maridesulfovibrio frigidus TaxID=340956 RepID=UPI0004E19A0A|nr:response regulator [Maridesulfovibrio frigidus]
MSHTVLVLDDDTYVRESIGMALEDSGLRIYQAESAETALKVLNTVQVDLVVVDLRLPGIDGIEFIDAAITLWPELKFIVYTGSPEYKIPVELENAVRVSNTIFLKPLPNSDEMLAEIERMLS